MPGGSQNLQNIFKGLRSCLQVNEKESDALLRVNQILYDMMQDLPRSPNELLPEVTTLLPYFIENLGNSKVSNPIHFFVDQADHSKDYVRMQSSEGLA